MIPYTKPYFWFLALMRCVIGVTMAGPISHPLINDYVRKNSRGKAIAFNGLGTVFGEVFAMGILLKLSKTMTYESAFTLTGSIIIAWGIYFSIFIKNPNLINIHKKYDKKNPTRRRSI